tara:strand:- start:766 stop:1026 length:261 start_codon:yes stop_codon:yes gene_type:complete
MEKKVGKMRSNAVYNSADNMVMVKTNGDEINVICNSEEQMDNVVKRLSTDTCLLSGYEEWDEGEDKKWILKFIVCDEKYEFVPELN